MHPGRRKLDWQREPSQQVKHTNNFDRSGFLAVARGGMGGGEDEGRDLNFCVRDTNR